eukprot:TRINITY_DN33945_c0_g1_i1.p1 TRINITY_DN33945_c0_g1~~TRINITY_DN33945_c0_g1_i1.p1  ORF type:complete len:404 (+),score=97.42 TRINITY_DN33945_c0_g1_i1:164-1213(+)
MDVEATELTSLALVCLWISAKQTETGSKSRVDVRTLAGAACLNVGTTRILDLETKILNYANCELQTPDAFTAFYTTLPLVLSYVMSQPPPLCRCEHITCDTIRVDVTTQDDELGTLINANADWSVATLLDAVNTRGKTAWRHVYLLSEVDGFPVCNKLSTDDKTTLRNLGWSENEKVLLCKDLAKTFFASTRRYEMGLAYVHYRELIMECEGMLKDCMRTPEIAKSMRGTDLGLLVMGVGCIRMSGARESGFLTFLDNINKQGDLFTKLFDKYGGTKPFASALPVEMPALLPTPVTPTDYHDAESCTPVSFCTVPPTPVSPPPTPEVGGMAKRFFGRFGRHHRPAGADF